MRIISDVHGKLDQYFDIANGSPDGYSLQLGDLGFSYHKLYTNLDKENHFFFKGNHDNYDVESDYSLESRLGRRYGELPQVLVERLRSNKILGLYDPFKTFYCDGGSSIDAAGRVKFYMESGVKTWWYEEEIPDAEHINVFDKYMELKPQVVFTHEFPANVTDIIMGGDTSLLEKLGWPKDYHSQTSLLLQSLFKNHQPKYWFGGHLHRNFDKVIDGCRFICMRELGFIDI